MTQKTSSYDPYKYCRRFGLSRKAMQESNWTPPGEEAPLCACGCGQRVSFNYNHVRWNKVVRGHFTPSIKQRISKTMHKKLSNGEIRPGPAKENYAPRKNKYGKILSLANQRRSNWRPGESPLCHCGCAQPVNFNYDKGHWNKFISGHNLELYRSANSKCFYPDEWTPKLRARIRERDKHTCRFCGIEDIDTRFLHVHHIDEDKFNCSEDNLITICNSCHTLYHIYPKHLVKKLIELGRLDGFSNVYPRMSKVYSFINSLSKTGGCYVGF